MNQQNGYYQDIRLLKSKTRISLFSVLSLGLILFPLIASSYSVYVVNYIALNVLVAIGLDLLMGQTGQVSLGHAGFVAIGAYAVVLLMNRLSLPFPLALFLAGLIAALFGFLLGLPALRLKGPYLAIATLGFGMAVIQVIGRWSLFGGHMGLQAPELELGPWLVRGDHALYALIIPITVAMCVMARNLRHTRIGRAFMAIRESEIAAASLGIDVARYKTMAFAISAFYAGVAGALWVFVLGYINPGMFDFFLSILFLAMIVVGGIGHPAGAILGAILITWLNLELGNPGELPLIGALLQQFSRDWMSVEGLANVRFVVFGLIMIGVVMFEPGGLYGIWGRIRHILMRRRYSGGGPL